MKTDRSKLISALEHEMLTNTQWLRIHAAEGLLDNGETGKIAELFRPEAGTATAPYRIGVWRVLARSTSGEERECYIERIREVMHDPQAIDRVSAAESLGKLNTASRADRDLISRWLTNADDATAPFPRWLLVLSSNPSERENDEAALAKLLSSHDPVARLRAAFALGRLKTLSPNSISKFREQLKVEPEDSIARVYFITALLLHVKDQALIVDLEKQLSPYLNNGKSNELLEIGIVFGLLGENGRARHSVRAVSQIPDSGAQRTDAPYLEVHGKSDRLSALKTLLTNSDPDARIGAANGLLQLLK